MPIGSDLPGTVKGRRIHENKWNKFHIEDFPSGKLTMISVDSNTTPPPPRKTEYRKIHYDVASEVGDSVCNV